MPIFFFNRLQTTINSLFLRDKNNGALLKEVDIESWYEQYVDELFAYGMAFCMNRETVLDAIQDVFLHLYEIEKRLDMPANVRAYLLGALKNRLISVMRKEVLFENLNEEGDSVFHIKVDAQALIEDVEECKYYEEQVEALLNLLTDKQREVIYLYYMQGLNYEEIASILKITPKSVRKIAYRAILRMQQSKNISFHLLLFFLMMPKG